MTCMDMVLAIRLLGLILVRGMGSRMNSQADSLICLVIPELHIVRLKMIFDAHMANMYGGMTTKHTDQFGLIGKIFELQARQSYKPPEAKKYEAPDVENL